MDCPFKIGVTVSWVPDAPDTWRFIWTPGPMVVIDALWHSGVPNEYAKMFDEKGMDITPDWILTVEHDADSTPYYDYPPSPSFSGKREPANSFTRNGWRERKAASAQLKRRHERRFYFNRLSAAS